MKVLMEWSKDGFYLIALKVIFQGLKGQNKVKVLYFDAFWQVSQNLSDNFSLCCAYSFLGMILINCQEIALIELFKMSFARSERSGLAYCSIVKCCSQMYCIIQFLCCEINPVLKYERCGITLKVISKVRKVQFGPW